MQIRIAPSVLAADFARLGDEARRMEMCGAPMLHLDVMDGAFVPNLTFGADVVRAVRPYSRAVFDVHLMICDPVRFVGDFRDAGADSITFHLEAADDPAAVIRAIRACGCRVGVAVKPATPVEALFPYLDTIDMALVMTVEPGFGGQSFMTDCLNKIRALRTECAKRGIALDIQVDGGITDSTVASAAAAGANVFVAGSAVFHSPDPQETILILQTIAEDSFGMDFDRRL